MKIFSQSSGHGPCLTRSPLTSAPGEVPGCSGIPVMGVCCSCFKACTSPDLLAVSSCGMLVALVLELSCLYLLVGLQELSFLDLLLQTLVYSQFSVGLPFQAAASSSWRTPAPSWGWLGGSLFPAEVAPDWSEPYSLSRAPGSVKSGNFLGRESFRKNGGKGVMPGAVASVHSLSGMACLERTPSSSVCGGEGRPLCRELVLRTLLEAVN